MSRGPTLTEDALRACDPGTLLATLLEAETDESLGADQLLTAVTGWERLLSIATAAQATALRRLDAAMTAEINALRGRADLDPTQEAVEEVALALRTSHRSATARLDLADRLQALPAAAQALRTGALGVTHARVLVDALTGLEPPLPERVRQRLDALLTQAAVERRLTPGQLRTRARRLVLTLDPHGSVQRRQAAMRGRDVSCRPDENGMAWLSAYLPAPAARACADALTAHARAGLQADPDDNRGLGARRADALVNLVLTGHADGNPPADAATPATVTVSLNVTVPITALDGTSDEPGELQGHGPLDASTVRLLADTPGTVVRRLLTDPANGRLLEVGASTYRPSRMLDRFVRLRDVTCRWPGCERPAHSCDLDHAIPWPNGGTTAENLLALCRRHHRLKTLGRFDLTRNPDDGSTSVDTPLERRYERDPGPD
jgi:hypothetical protein